MDNLIDQTTDSNSLQGPANLYGGDDGGELLSRELDFTSRQREVESSGDSEESLEIRFETSRLINHITASQAKKIALQFPDHLLHVSGLISKILQQHCPESEFFILADTSYGSCCNDEVAASHAEADFLVHFGHSCLSRIENEFPVAYSYDRQGLNIDECISQLLPQVKDIEQLLITAELGLSHHLDAIKQRLDHSLNNETRVIIGKIPHGQNLVAMPSFTGEYGGDLTELERQRESGNLIKLCGRFFPATVFEQPDKSAVIYVGGETIELTNMLMTAVPELKVIRYDPEKSLGLVEGQSINRRLMRRYHLVQKARDASVFGIVVGTLGVANYRAVIDTTRDLIKKYGGKSYTFVMGKLNVAKLANFLEIDVYILVACPENSLIDSKEFLRPIITPFELRLALQPGAEWTGRLATEFRDILSLDTTASLEEKAENVNNEEEEEQLPHFSLVTGKLVQPRRHYSNHIDIELESSTVLLRNDPKEISRGLGSAAGEFLASRTFQGLDPTPSKEVHKAEEGRIGIARGYRNEKEL